MIDYLKVYRNDFKGSRQSNFDRKYEDYKRTEQERKEKMGKQQNRRHRHGDEQYSPGKQRSNESSPRNLDSFMEVSRPFHKTQSSQKYNLLSN